MSDRMYDNGWQDGYLRRERELKENCPLLARWLMRRMWLGEDQEAAILADRLEHHKPNDPMRRA